MFIKFIYLLTYRTAPFPVSSTWLLLIRSSVYYLFFVFIPYFILYVFLCMCVWCLHICVYVLKPEVDVRYLPRLHAILG